MGRHAGIEACMQGSRIFCVCLYRSRSRVLTDFTSFCLALCGSTYAPNNLKKIAHEILASAAAMAAEIALTQVVWSKSTISSDLAEKLEREKLLNLKSTLNAVSTLAGVESRVYANLLDLYPITYIHRSATHRCPTSLLCSWTPLPLSQPVVVMSSRPPRMKGSSHICFPSP